MPLASGGLGGMREAKTIRAPQATRARLLYNPKDLPPLYSPPRPTRCPPRRLYKKRRKKSSIPWGNAKTCRSLFHSFFVTFRLVFRFCRLVRFRSTFPSRRVRCRSMFPDFGRFFLPTGCDFGRLFSPGRAVSPLRGHNTTPKRGSL